MLPPKSCQFVFLIPCLWRIPPFAGMAGVGWGIKLTLILTSIWLRICLISPWTYFLIFPGDL